MDTSPKSDIEEHGTERTARRARSLDEKLAILREAAQPGASIAAVARKHGMNANLLFGWRLLLEKPMSELNPWLIEGWRKRQLEERRQPVTINRNLQRLQGVLSKAVEWNVLQQHPFSGLTRPRGFAAGFDRGAGAW